ncbi:hypothetical protein H0H87_006787 [Tephrocybe sp. NHM501043]|nr:hypothetical protein H0H87_006787 [Tephrocybe sp. NHM501043]
MRFSTAIFSAVAVLFVGVAQAIPYGGGRASGSQALWVSSPSTPDARMLTLAFISVSRDTRGESYNEVAARAVYNNLPERGLEYDGLSERSLTDLYIRDVEKYSARRLSRLDRRGDDTCPVCWEKIRAPDTMTAMCSVSRLHEMCANCVVKVLMEMENKCPQCRGALDGHSITNRVCKQATPPGSPKAGSPPPSPGKKTRSL